jgi:hypothetical protein
MSLKAKGFAAVRKDTSTGNLWLDTSSFSFLLEETQHKLRDLANAIPSWEDANPVEYIADVELVELGKVKK